MGLRQVSPDGNLLAYTQDTTGSEWYTVHVKDLRTGRLLPDAIDSVSYGLEWAADNRTLFFTRDNAAHRPDRIFRRTLGDRGQSLVVSEPDSLYFLGLGKTKDRTYLLATSQSFTTGEVRFSPPTSRRPHGRSCCRGVRASSIPPSTMARASWC